MVEDDSESDEALSGATGASFVLGGVLLANVLVFVYYAHFSERNSGNAFGLYCYLLAIVVGALVVSFLLLLVAQMFSRSATQQEPEDDGKAV